MIDPRVCEGMREDWNRRAREDANYYVAFGRREQDDAEFFATAADVVRNLTRELRRLPEGDPQSRRALEIGCGPGRLMLPMSRHFGEVYGVDISDDMIRLAKEKLRNIPHAHASVASGADLAGFADESFDFVYSYAVFQHIPNREVVFNYLREALRVLKPEGVLRCQINGLPETAARYDTWNGVRIRAGELVEFARERDFRLLALEGIATQYMWITALKAPRAKKCAPAMGARIRRITNAHSSEPLAPCRGRFASIAIGMEGLPREYDLPDLRAFIGPNEGRLFYVGPPEADKLQQLNVALPEGVPTGLQNLRLEWLGQPVCPDGVLRVVRPGPVVPRIIAVTDGIDLLSGTRIASGVIKVTVEEMDRPEGLKAMVAGHPLLEPDIFCVDPVPPRHEVNLKLPEAVPPGIHLLELSLGRRRFAPVTIEIA
jgi:ubiquinone/menaquinone biosynthesis C-methylase UbiE